MTAARNVTATFNTTVSDFVRSVTKAGTGAGTVTSSPAGINCGTTCSATYRQRHLGDAHRGGGGRLDVRRLEWGVHGHGHLHGVDDRGAQRDRDVQHDRTGTMCANPVTFTNNTGNFNTTGAACYRTSANVNGWGCSNFDGRTVTVGGVARTCGQLP